MMVERTAGSEEFADRSFDMVTSLLNYVQRVKSLIFGPDYYALLWFVGIVSIRIALGGFLDLALVSSRRFPHRCFLPFTRSDCDFFVFTPSDCARGI
jgi:hypothetical protein